MGSNVNTVVCIDAQREKIEPAVIDSIFRAPRKLKIISLYTCALYLVGATDRHASVIQSGEAVDF